MLTFNYTATINALPVDDDKRCIETLTGEVSASDHTQAKQQASRLAFNRCRRLEQEQGGIIGYENVQVTCRVETPETAPQDYFARARIEATFLNTLKQRICAVTKSLDQTSLFDQSLEVTSVKHAVTILLSELEVHGLLPEPSIITPYEYQRCALRTLYPPDLPFKDRLGLCGIGLPSELGEALDYIKKFLYHRSGLPLAVDQIKDELGDMLWYFFILLDTLGLTFEEVMMANAQKLEERHPNGFNPHYASDSHASEEPQ